MTSEEKLLNIIRKKKHLPKDGQADVKKDKESVKAESESAQNGNDFNPDILKWINRALCAVSFLIFFYVLTQYTQGMGKEGLPGRQAGVLLASLEKGKSEEKKVEKSDVLKISFSEKKPFSVYQEKFQQRDIFQAPWDKPKEDAAQEASSSTDLSKQLKLIGVLLDKDSRAIIENVQTKETVFLSVGQDIEGATLEEIKEGKAIFRINDQRVELTQ